MKRKNLAGAWLGISLTAVTICAVAGPLPAHATVVSLDIKSQPITAALNDFGQQTGIQVLFYSDVADGVKEAPALTGTFTPDEALTQLLSKTGLMYSYIDERTVAIHRAISNASESETREEQGRPVMRLAKYEQISERPHNLVAQETGQDAGRQHSSSEDLQRRTIEEVIVTARKRTERLQDVPVPVTVIDADQLVNGNQLRFQDYYSSVPGFSYQAGNMGAAVLAIRGITSGVFSAPTVGVVIDDVPYGSSTGLGAGGFGVPDIDPSDFTRVEVLRGPQGTLYGASSMGGLLKFTTVDPSTDGFSGRLQAGSNSVRNGDELGYSVRGALNFPLGDTMAVRGTAFTRRDPGYIDNIRTGEEAINDSSVDGGRLAALWRPTEETSVKLSALYQNTRSDEGNFVYRGPGLSDLQQDTIPNSGKQQQEVQAYSANVTTRLGNVDLTALSGYSVARMQRSIDYTNTRGATTLAVYGVSNTTLGGPSRTRKFSQEIRLSSEIDRFEWLFGGFYTREKNFGADVIDAVTDTGDLLVRDLDAGIDGKFSEYAAFATLTYHITDRFDMQFGARQSYIEQDQSQVWIGPFVPRGLGVPSPFVPPDVHMSDQAFTYLVTPQFKLTSDLMVYARIASGYRPGGPNSNSTVNALPTFEPDRTQNYEIGLKGDLGDSVFVDVSFYHIGWKDLQIQLIDPARNVAIYSNASEAKSEGGEVSVSWQPWNGMSIAAWASYNDAALTEDFPPSAGTLAFGASGDRLPISSRRSGSLTLNQDFALRGGMTGHIGGAVSYVGDRVGPFRARDLPRQEMPAYTKVDVNAGLKFESWSIDLYVNNVGDKRGLLRGGLGFSLPYAFYYIQPRTAGLSLTRSFD